MKSNRPSARTMRRSTAYARLAAKAYKAGQHSEFMRYSRESLRLKKQAWAMQDREAEREQQRADGLRRFKSLS